MVSGLIIWPKDDGGGKHHSFAQCVYVLRALNWETCRKHRWHSTCFQKVSSLPQFQRTGDGRVHRLLGMSMKVKICLREDVLIAYDRAVGDADV